MKTHSSTQDHDPKPRATARQLEQDSVKVESDIKDESVQSRKQISIDTSPYIAAQRKHLAGMTGAVIQKQLPEEEEELQGKFAAQRQLEEEEELPMQGKFAAQRQASLEEEELAQGKFTAQRQTEEEEELMQGKFAVQRSPSEENRTGLPDGVKSKMEASFGADFSAVRVHPNSTKATEVDALAYTQGADIHFAPGQFKPESSAGQQLLGHELTHVVQQNQGRVKPTREVAGLPVNDDPGLEKEADEAGKKL